MSETFGRFGHLLSCEQELKVEGEIVYMLCLNLETKTKNLWSSALSETVARKIKRSM
jgi:hypothetical protein